MKTKQNKKGFTLVEIMIVVVIIGLLAAMAIPAFQKVRVSSIEKTIINDGRIIGSSLQQAFMESGETTLALDFTTGNPGSWTISGTNLGGGYTGTLSQGVSGTTVAALDLETGTFELTHSQYDETSYSNSAHTVTNGIRFDSAGRPAAAGAPAPAPTP